MYVCMNCSTRHDGNPYIQGQVYEVDEATSQRWAKCGIASIAHPVEADKPLDKMTVEELKAYAAAHGIELPEKGVKADILTAIQAQQ